MVEYGPTGQPDPGCIFCKIVAGQIPCYKLFEDGQIIAFLDVGPLAQGHCLIVPKAHFVTLDQMSAESAAACVQLAPRLGRAVLAFTGAKAWNLLQNNGKAAGQAVDHVHFHVIPRAVGDGLGFRWPAQKLDPATAKAIQQGITAGL